MIGEQCPHCEIVIKWYRDLADQKTIIIHGEDTTEFSDHLYARINYSPIKTWLHKIHNIASLDIF